jgi:hypothetical protein
MLASTHSAWAPWTIVHTDHKKRARLAVLSHILHTLAPPHLRDQAPACDAEVLYDFSEEAVTKGKLAP